MLIAHRHWFYKHKTNNPHLFLKLENPHLFLKLEKPTTEEKNDPM